MARNSIDPFLPDPSTYTLVINERMRKLLHMMSAELAGRINDGEDVPIDDADKEVVISMADMLDPEGSIGPLAPSPAVNGFVL